MQWVVCAYYPGGVRLSVWVLVSIIHPWGAYSTSLSHRPLNLCSLTVIIRVISIGKETYRNKKKEKYDTYEMI